MTRGSNSGPAVMMMPPHIRATFMPNPPLKQIPPVRTRRKTPISGVMDYLKSFETGPPNERVIQPTPKALKEAKIKKREKDHLEKLEPSIEVYRKQQRDCGGEYQGMNCYNTLFVGRLAYEVTERKLLREMEAFGPVKDIKLVRESDSKSRGYGFVEYENEEDMKRAYRAADGMRVEGREIVADVERGHTVPSWLPRRLGGGLGGTRCAYIHCSNKFPYPLPYVSNPNLFLVYFRLGGKDKNVRRPGRFDPSRVDISRSVAPVMDGPPGGMGRGQSPPPYGGGYESNRGRYGGPPPGPFGRGGRGDWGGDRSSHDGGRRRRRSRSRSPDRRYAPRPRY
jgi:U1 small nuclear ribonucleoprotein